MFYTFIIFFFFLPGCWIYLCIYSIAKLHSVNILQRIVLTIFILIIKISWIHLFPILWKIYDTMSNRRIVDSHSNTPSGHGNDDIKNQTENNTESLQDETSVEPNTNPSVNTQQNLPQIPESSHSEIVTGQIPNLSVELQQHFSAVFSSEETQTEIEPSRLQHQRSIEAANQFLRKQELERNQLIQQFNQRDTDIQYNIVRSEKNSTDTFNIKEGATTTSYTIWIFHAYAILVPSH